MRRFFLLILIVVVAACSSEPGDDPAPGTTGSSATTAPQQAGLPDLIVTAVRVEASQSSGFDHDLVMTVDNQGDTDASGFSAGCEWICPGGTISGAGAGAVQGGYLGAHSSLTYRSAFRVQCAGPPAVLDMTCDPDSYNDVTEAREDNNLWQAPVSIP